MTDHTKLAVPEQGSHEQLLLFGPRPLIEGEDGAAYDELVARFSAAIKPKDFLEEMWMRDVVDLTWETLRMRRLKAALLTSGMSEGLHATTGSAVGLVRGREPFKAMGGPRSASHQRGGQTTRLGWG